MTIVIEKNFLSTDENKAFDSVNELILSSGLSGKMYLKSYYDGWQDTLDGPKGGHYVHTTGATNTAPTIGSPVPVSTIGTGAQAGYYWDADGKEWVISASQTITPYMLGAVDNVDSSDALDNFATFLANHLQYDYEIIGNYLISRPWLFDHSGIAVLNWSLKLTPTTNMQCALALEGTNVAHAGEIEIFGSGGTGDWSTFVLDYGVIISGCQGSELPAIRTFKCRNWGIVYNEDGTIGIPLKSGQLSKNNTVLTFEMVHCRDCGGYNTGYSGGGTLNNLGFLAAFSNPVRSGSAGSNGQFTTIDVDVLPPVSISTENPIFAVINDKTFRVINTSGTSGAGTIDLFPWMDPTWLSGDVSYFWGGSIHCTGADGGVTKILKIDSIRCAISLLDGALFGTTTIQNVTQFCSVALMIGKDQASIAPQSSSHIGVYAEGVYRNMLQIGNGSASVFNRYESFAGEPFTNCESIYRQDTTGVALTFDGSWYSRIFMPETDNSRSLFGLYSKRSANLTDSSIILGPESAVDQSYQRNSWTINLSDATDINAKSGLDTTVLKMHSSSLARGAPNGTFTFNAPAGWTVNNAASFAFSDFYEMAVFEIVWNMATSNVWVRCLSRRGRTSAPVAGTWERGDIVYNTSPAVGQPKGWICTVSGTPGTWVSKGNL